MTLQSFQDGPRQPARNADAVFTLGYQTSRFPSRYRPHPETARTATQREISPDLADAYAMRFPRNPKMTMETQATSDRRRHGRLRCESTCSCIGNVLDISASGMRVQRTGRHVMEVGDGFRITVHPDAGEPILTLPSRVVWIERKSFRKHVYGIEFAELNDDQKRLLGELARIVCDLIVFRCAS